MKRRIFYLLIAALSGFASCTKKVESNEIIKFPYNTPTYTSVAGSNQPIYYNTYFSDQDNAISLYASGNNGSGVTISKKTSGTGFQTSSVFPQMDEAGLLTMANPGTGYFAGGPYFQDLYRTTDGGNTWRMVNSANVDILSLAAPDANTVYLISSSTILKSIDGGTTFHVILPQDFQHSPTHVYFYNSSIGFALQDRGRIVKTSDGGQTWTTYTLPTNGTGDVGDIFFTDVNKGYALAGGENYLFGTTDGGKTWSRLVKNDLINSGKVFFYPDGRGIIAVRGQYILYSRDFGQTAKLFLNITGNNSSTNINAVNDSTIMLSTDTKIYKVNFSKK